MAGRENLLFVLYLPVIRVFGTAQKERDNLGEHAENDQYYGSSLEATKIAKTDTESGVETCDATNHEQHPADSKHCLHALHRLGSTKT
jgi:hypothetical protein